VVQNSYLVRTLAQTIRVKAVNLANGWPDSAHLFTTNTYYTNGSFSGYLRSIRHPDKTGTTYLYDTNATQATTIILNGQTDPTNPTNILDGTKTAIIVGMNGQTLSRTVYSIPENTTLSQETYSDFDDRFRPGRVTFIDGTYVVTTYDCCGVSSVTERDGTHADYTYDDLKRLVTQTRNGITTTYTYDGAGNRLTAVRTGTDLSTVYLQRSGYDTAGRLIVETNALGYITAYSELVISNQLLKTTSFPDGGTRTNWYARDGSLLEVSGMAAAPVRYQYGVVNDGGW